MALNIKNLHVEQLATEVSELTGESKTEAIRVALEERKAHLDATRRTLNHEDFMAYMEREVWSKLPPGERGRRLTQKEEDDILGYGPEGF